MSQEDSCYSTDEEYFMDLCRGNQFEELKEFINSLPENSEFNWGWCNYSGDNFMHMIAANNFPELFDYLLPVLNQKCPKQLLEEIINKQNSSRATPLHYAVVTDSKDMVKRLVQAGANPQITNQQNRTPLGEAQKFQKYEIAEILAPITKTDLEALKKQVADVKLNDDDDSDEEEQKQPLPTINEDKEQTQQKKQEQQENPNSKEQQKKQ